MIFKDKPTDNKEILKIKEYFKKKYGKNILDICEDFDEIYKDILDYFKDTEKTLVIDSAQYRNLKDLSLLEGQIIMMRTCADTCYKRCIERWKNNHKRYNKEELEKYTNKKLKMYICYKNLNKFIERVNEM